MVFPRKHEIVNIKNVQKTIYDLYNIVHIKNVPNSIYNHKYTILYIVHIK